MNFSDYVFKCSIIYEVLHYDVYLFDTNNNNIYSITSHEYPKFFRDFISREMNQFLHYMNQSNILHVHYYSSAYYLNFIGISFWEKNSFNGAVLIGPILEKSYNLTDFTTKYSSEIQKIGSIKTITSFYEKLPIISNNQSQKVIELINHLFIHPFFKKKINYIHHFKKESLNNNTKVNVFDDFLYWKEHYEEENHLIEAITKGDITEAVEVVKKIILNSTSKSNTGSLKRTKDLLTLANSNFARIAIKKNVPLMVAYTATNTFGSMIERASTASECYQIVIEIIEEYTNLINQYSFNVYSKLVNQAIASITKHSRESISLKDIAHELFVSPAHLSRKFKEETNMTITEYIHKIRIDSAIELLKLKRYSLLEISEMVGYINYSHFNKWFKTFTGMSPKQFQFTL